MDSNGLLALSEVMDVEGSLECVCTTVIFEVPSWDTPPSDEGVVSSEGSG